MKYLGNDDEQVIIVIPLLLLLLLLLPLLAAHRRTKETKRHVEFMLPRHLSACPTLLTSLLPFGGDVDRAVRKPALKTRNFAISHLK
jgi:hypothetical protein